MAPRPVAELDLPRYSGLWYEIRRSDNAFQRACLPGTTTARYTLQDHGRSVLVENQCTSTDGRIRRARGVGWQKKGGQLRVSFLSFLPVSLLRRLPFVSASYDVIYVSPDYREAVVRSGRLWWVLARTPTLSDARRKVLVALARSE